MSNELDNQTPLNTSLPATIITLIKNTTLTSNDTESECYYSRHEWLGEKLVLMSFVGTTIAMLGIIGNLTTAVILTRPSMRSPNNLYLTALAVFDTCLLVTAILIYSLEYIIEYTSNFELYVAWLTYLRFCYALSHIAQTGSVYTTVAVTLERFLAVVHPNRGRTLCTKRGAGISILFVTIFAILFNCTKFFELEIRRQSECAEFEAYSLGTGPLVTHYYHLLYSLWVTNIVMVFFPFLSLLFFNSVIAWTIRKSLHRLAWASARLGDRRNELKEKSRDATRVLVIIVLIFLICNLWGFVITLLESIYGGRQLSMKYKKFYTFSRESVNFLAIINSSINFVIYCIFGKDFRKELIVVYGCRISIPMLMPTEDKFSAFNSLRSRLNNEPKRTGGFKRKRDKGDNQKTTPSVQVQIDGESKTDSACLEDTELFDQDIIDPNVFGRPDYIPHSLRGKRDTSSTSFLNVSKLTRAASICSRRLSNVSSNLIANGEVSSKKAKTIVKHAKEGPRISSPSSLNPTSISRSYSGSSMYLRSSTMSSPRSLDESKEESHHLLGDSNEPTNSSPPCHLIIPKVQLTLINSHQMCNDNERERDSSPAMTNDSDDTTVWL